MPQSRRIGLTRFIWIDIRRRFFIFTIRHLTTNTKWETHKGYICLPIMPPAQKFSVGPYHVAYYQNLVGLFICWIILVFDQLRTLRKQLRTRSHSSLACPLRPSRGPPWPNGSAVDSKAKGLGCDPDTSLGHDSPYLHLIALAVTMHKTANI